MKKVSGNARMKIRRRGRRWGSKRRKGERGKEEGGGGGDTEIRG